MLPSSDVLTRETHHPDDSREAVVSPRWRRGLLRGIAVASCAMGVIFICIASNPSTLTMLSTPQLLGMMMLTIGPAMTVWAIRFDRRVAAQPVADQAGTEVVESDARVMHHDAHDRSKRVLARVEEAHSTPSRVHEPAA